MPAYAHLFFERFPTIVQVDQFRREAESSVSSVSSDDGDGAATVAPVSAPIYSPRSLKVDLEAEAQRYKRILMSPPTSSIENSMDGKETTMFDAEAASDTTLELEEYEQQRNERIAKWKEQLDALSSRKLQLEDDARPVITRVATAMSSQVASNFHTKRVEAMERAQTSTEAAIADATKHFHEVNTTAKSLLFLFDGYYDPIELAADGSRASRVATRLPEPRVVAELVSAGLQFLLQSTSVLHGFYTSFDI